MTAIRARVRGGRLVADAPTDLPEGLEVTLAVVDDDRDESRRALEASIEESYAELERGELLDAADVLRGLRSTRSAGQ